MPALLMACPRLPWLRDIGGHDPAESYPDQPLSDEPCREILRSLPFKYPLRFLLHRLALALEESHVSFKDK